MKKENRFIISLILSRHDIQQLNIMKKLILEQLDWGYISHQIIMHRIAGIIVENLKYHRLIHKVPKSILIYLCDSYTVVQYRHNNYLKELKVVTSALNNAGIKYVIVKGIHLVLSLYDDFVRNPRDYSDLDIVVSKQDLEKVGTTLEKIGYHHTRIDYNTDECNQIKREEILQGKMFFHQIPPYEKQFEDYFVGRNVYKIDVNYSIFEGGQHIDPIPIGDLLERRYFNTSSVADYYSLCIEDDLIQNCFHFYKDILYPPKNKRRDVYKLINLYDLYLLFNKNKAIYDYDYLLDKCNNVKIKQSIYVTINLVEGIFGSLNINDFKSHISCEIPQYLQNKFEKGIEYVFFGTKSFDL